MPDDLYDPVYDDVELPPELGAPLRDRIIDQVLFLNAIDRHRNEPPPTSE